MFWSTQGIHGQARNISQRNPVWKQKRKQQKQQLTGVTAAFWCGGELTKLRQGSSLCFPNSPMKCDGVVCDWVPVHKVCRIPTWPQFGHYSKYLHWGVFRGRSFILSAGGFSSRNSVTSPIEEALTGSNMLGSLLSRSSWGVVDMVAKLTLQLLCGYVCCTYAYMYVLMGKPESNIKYLLDTAS